MTKEEKQLLLKDLCGRLPYGTICRCRTTEDSTWWNTDHRIFGIIGNKVDVGSDIIDAEQIKPYLRPLSSMTEEEKIELCTIAYAPDEMKTIEEKLHVVKTNAKNAADFYNEHHFDHRGLIPIGLALEAPEGMYKTK